MTAETRTGTRRFRLAYLLALIGLVIGLTLPGAAMAQGLKDRPSDDPATEEPADEPEDEPTEEPEDEPADEPTDPEDLEAAGLVGTRSYESPQFGYTIDWSRDWDVDTYYDPAVISDEEIEQDMIYLIWSDGDGAEAYVVVSGQTANRGGAEGDVEEWTDPEFIEDQWDPAFDIEVLLDDSTSDAGAVLYSVSDSENDQLYYTIYQSLELEDGTTLYLTFSAHEDWVEDAYTSWSEDIEIDGAPIDVVFEWADIEEVL
jgi:hypothetical protein